MRLNDLEELIDKYQKAKKKLDKLQKTKDDLTLFEIANRNCKPRFNVMFGLTQVTIEEFTTDEIHQFCDKIIEGLKADIELYRIQLEKLGFE